VWTSHCPSTCPPQTEADSTTVTLLVHGLNNLNYRFKMELAQAIKGREVYVSPSPLA
jgi:hypothetical protein